MQDKNIVSFATFDNGSFFEENYFSEVKTLDPSQVISAWDRLSEDAFSVHIASIPTILHSSLVKTISERSNNRVKTNKTSKRRHRVTSPIQGRRDIAA